VGSLTLPHSGCIYADTQVFIYSVEKVPEYAQLLRPLWLGAHRGQIQVITSELTTMETLVTPFRQNDMNLVRDYEQSFQQGGVGLRRIEQATLREAARLRAQVRSLRTPDAIHAATALLADCALFLTNDKGFRQVPNLPVAILSDVLAS
jgi:predicted nucleic acid-binding protein